jgi:hypothetical protein
LTIADKAAPTSATEVSDIDITEEKIMSNNDSLKKLLNSLEKKQKARKENDEE